MVTGTVFESTYRGGDSEWRSTRFNHGFSGAVLGGKEWEFRGSEKGCFLGVNGRITIMGCNRHSRVDEQRSHWVRAIIYNESVAPCEREVNIFYPDINTVFKTNRRKTSSVSSVQLMNITGHQEFYGYQYNLRKHRIDAERELILIPNISYKIEF